ncbi:hypothetical protein B0A55_02281 [Friedmanniomyces simplex]|uniref:Uncharacterized protein n=1 Tax=Friedmanniomyces simplex TaxID=329884 RepID=A0A4U0Y1H7_9PEZI|nr:hypothetical protein B0A55_02281 [Friedmanniomyces simplex]
MGALERFATAFSRLHILITSRKYPDIEQFMLDWNPSVSELLPEYVNEDISAFVRHELSSSVKFRRFEERSKILITSTLGGNPEGMFRWASLHLEQLRDRKNKNHAKIERALNTLPRTLGATYDKLLSNIPPDCVDQAVRGLIWLAHAPSPLSADELAEAMCVDPDVEGAIVENDGVTVAELQEILLGLVELHPVVKSHGADVNSYDFSNRTALHEASFCEETAALEMLLSHRADVNIRGLDGKTALWIAADHGYPAVAEKLLAVPQDLEIVDLHEGQTALCAAVRYAIKGSGRLVELLTEHGADINAVAEFRYRNKEGSFEDRTGSALDAADYKRDEDVVDYLEKHGAKRLADMDEEERERRVAKLEAVLQAWPELEAQMEAEWEARKPINTSGGVDDEPVEVPRSLEVSPRIHELAKAST